METDAETLEVSWAQLKASPAWTYLVVPLLSERRKSLYEKLAISGSIEDVRYIQGQIAVLTDVLETPTKASRAATKAGAQACSYPGYSGDRSYPAIGHRRVSATYRSHAGYVRSCPIYASSDGHNAKHGSERDAGHFLCSNADDAPLGRTPRVGGAVRSWNIPQSTASCC